MAATIVRARVGTRRACPTTSPWSAGSSEGVYHQFGFFGVRFPVGPGTGAMAELFATGRTNVPIDGPGIARA